MPSKHILGTGPNSFKRREGCGHCDFSVLDLTGAPQLSRGVCTPGPRGSRGSWSDGFIPEHLSCCCSRAPPAVCGAGGSLMQSQFHRRGESPCSPRCVSGRRIYGEGTEHFPGLPSSLCVHFPRHRSSRPSSFSCPENPENIYHRSRSLSVTFASRLLPLSPTQVGGWRPPVCFDGGHSPDPLGTGSLIHGSLAAEIWSQGARKIDPILFSRKN